jgi:phospholipase C
MRKYAVPALLATLVAGSLAAFAAMQTSGVKQPQETATPVKHLVIIFDENISFDHYFGAYPNALNPPGEPAFKALPGTPAVNGLTPTLLNHNPNFVNTKINQSNAVNPFRLSRSQAATADQGHGYTQEQQAFDAGLMDAFPRYTGSGGRSAQEQPPPEVAGLPPQSLAQSKSLVMGYYDGNTVTALWNYAQRYSLSDNSYSSVFGPSTPGAIDLVSGQTNGVSDQINAGSTVTDGGKGTVTMIGDGDPIGDLCSGTNGPQLQLSGRNIGEMLSERGVTWGWFETGFDLTKKNPNGTTGCARSTYSNVTHLTVRDYVPHHQPFQYYKETSNPSHLRPTSVSLIGKDGDGARHQYDVDDFFAAVKAGNFPSVNFLKAPAYQDGHAGYSDPLDEQTFLVHVINFLEQQPEWKNTAIIVAYDDSDGWYDHQMGPIVNQSAGKTDALTGPGQCGNAETALPGPKVAHALGRCGYGTRQPLLVISPFARRNYVDHAVTDQTSILRFIEDNWLGGERVGQGSFDSIAGPLTGMFDFQHPDASKYLLDESSGRVVGR